MTEQLHYRIINFNDTSIKGCLAEDGATVWHVIGNQFLGYIQLNLTDLSLIGGTKHLSYFYPKIFSITINYNIIYVFCRVQMLADSVETNDVLMTISTDTRNVTGLYFFDQNNYYTSISEVFIASVSSTMHIIGGRSINSQDYVNHDELLLPYSEYGIPNYLLNSSTFYLNSTSVVMFEPEADNSNLSNFSLISPLTPSTHTSSPASSVVLEVDKIDSYDVWRPQSSYQTLTMNINQGCMSNYSIPYTSNTLNHSLSYGYESYDWLRFFESNGTLIIQEASGSSKNFNLTVNTFFANGKNTTTLNIKVKECGIFKCDV